MPQEKEEQERKVRTNLLGCPHFDDDALRRYFSYGDGEIRTPILPGPLHPSTGLVRIWVFTYKPVTNIPIYKYRQGNVLREYHLSRYSPNLRC